MSNILYIINDLVTDKTKKNDLQPNLFSQISHYLSDIESKICQFEEVKNIFAHIHNLTPHINQILNKRLNSDIISNKNTIHLDTLTQQYVNYIREINHHQKKIEFILKNLINHLNQKYNDINLKTIQHDTVEKLKRLLYMTNEISDSFNVNAQNQKFYDDFIDYTEKVTSNMRIISNLILK